MSRQRSTWSQPSGSRQAATKRQADIYNMNQERVQPSPVEYQNGDPDSWAETPVSNKHIEMEYEGDHVKRNEVGFAEFRDDTWKHKDSDVWGGSGKYDNQKLAAAKDKAVRVEKIARHLLRTSNEDLVSGQMLDLMGMPEPILAATLKRLAAASPETLTHQQKLARAHACCKLASRLLPGAGEEENGPVEKLARTFASIDDPTLKAILRQVAAHQVAADEDEDEDAPEKTEASAPAAPAEKTEASAPPAPPAPPPAKSEACGEAMSGPDMAELDALLHSEMGAPAAAPSPELTQLFTPPAPAMPMPAPLATSTAQAGSVDIQFGDEEMDVSPNAAVAAGAPSQGSADLDGLFSDHPEVMAQRQIRAAEYEAVNGAPTGYGQPGVRTASTQGAKKIGHVQATAGNPVDDLSNLWR